MVQWLYLLIWGKGENIFISVQDAHILLGGNRVVLLLEGSLSVCGRTDMEVHGQRAGLCASPAYCLFIPNPPYMVLFLMLEHLRLAGWPGYQLCHWEHWRDTEEEGLLLLLGCAPIGGPRPEAVSQWVVCSDPCRDATSCESQHHSNKLGDSLWWEKSDCCPHPTASSSWRGRATSERPPGPHEKITFNLSWLQP